MVCGFAALFRIEFWLSFDWVLIGFWLCFDFSLVCLSQHLFGRIWVYCSARVIFLNEFLTDFFCQTNFGLLDGKTVCRQNFRYFLIEILLIFVIFHLFPVSGCDSFPFYRQVCFKSFLTVKVPCSEVPVVPRTAWKTFLGFFRCDPKFSIF